MKNKLFKPTKEIEFNLMKTLLSNYTKLSLFIHDFKEANDVWVNSMNKELYQILLNNHHPMDELDNASIDKFYLLVWDKFQEKYSDLELEIYSELFQKDYNFFKTLENYRDFVFRKKILNELEQLKLMIENDALIEQRELDKLKKMLDLGTFYYE